jgi:uncharacterized protein
MKKINIIVIVSVLLVACVSIYGFFIEPENIEVTHLWPDSPVLKSKLKGKTAIHLSDFHTAGIGSKEKQVLGILNDIKPDFIFLTGDYVKWDGDYETTMKFMARLKAKDGVYAAMGDYDYSNSRKNCLFCHENGSGKFTGQHHVKFLRNNRTDVLLPGGRLTIAGVDDKDEDKKYDISGADIILSHSPLFFDNVDTNSHALVLSGDTHGGQIPLPAWIWSILGYEKNARYECGLFKKRNKMMYVSRGFGTSHLRFRFLRRPEVVVLHF